MNRIWPQLTVWSVKLNQPVDPELKYLVYHCVCTRLRYEQTYRGYTKDHVLESSTSSFKLAHTTPNIYIVTPALDTQTSRAHQLAVSGHIARSCCSRCSVFLWPAAGCAARNLPTALPATAWSQFHALLGVGQTCPFIRTSSYL